MFPEYFAAYNLMTRITEYGDYLSDQVVNTSHKSRQNAFYDVTYTFATKKYLSDLPTDI